MPIPEAQLERWSHQGAVTTAKQTHESIRNALKQYKPLKGLDFEVYLQGSYKNSTNIRGDSDVDVVVQLNSAFRSNLTEEQERVFRFTNASYGWWDFRDDVLKALRCYYGTGKVREGRKSLKVQTPYLPADVVVCIQYRKYPLQPKSARDYVEGMTFYVPLEDRWVVNYPKLHYQNGVKKNLRTDRYKPTVRMFKNARTYLIDRGEMQKDLAPSYFLECFLYNVPDSEYMGSFQKIFLKAMGWLINNHTQWSSFMCQNGQDPLFGSSPEQWSEESAVQFIKAMLDLWENWG